jgi:opacity protein-like surface antigen
MFNKYLAAGMLALAASAACATPTGLYAGVSAGVTRVDDVDGNKTNVGAFAGYGFNSTLAFEVGYRQHGDWDFYGTEVKLRQTEFSALGSLPLSRSLDLFARVGYGYGRVEGARADYRVAGNSDTAIYGIGLAYNFSKNLSARVELQKPSNDINTTNASLVWKF